MAHEAVLLVQTHNPIDMACAVGTGIPKGTLLALSDLNTVVAHSSASEIFGGITAKEKIADDGKTTVSVFRDGIFRLYLSGSCTLGQPLALGPAANAVIVAPAAKLSGGAMLGIPMEVGANSETIRVELRIGAGGGAA